VLTPGILLRLPPKSSPSIVALTHAIIFALIWWLIHKPLWAATSRMTEGMASATLPPGKKKGSPMLPGLPKHK
jgi:hypothetical protein